LHLIDHKTQEKKKEKMKNKKNKKKNKKKEEEEKKKTKIFILHTEVLNEPFRPNSEFRNFMGLWLHKTDRFI
jgi:hypothetical protein